LLAERLAGGSHLRDRARVKVRILPTDVAPALEAALQAHGRAGPRDYEHRTTSFLWSIALLVNNDLDVTAELHQTSDASRGADCWDDGA
jgi:hypothetical protein